MDVVSTCGLPVAALRWQPHPNAWAVTVICKATFLVDASGLVLAPEQEPPIADDVFWNSDPRCSLRGATDVVPLKDHVDVVVVGHAFAPHGAPLNKLYTRLVVGHVDKSLEIVGDRRASGPDTTQAEAIEFDSMPLVYERAVGGPGAVNPVGRPLEGKPGGAMPNIRSFTSSLGARTGGVVAPGYGPIAPAWNVRRHWLGAHAAAWASEDWRAQPFPAEVSFAYFNHAPPDQQLEELRPGEVVSLENLHPTEPYLSFEVPNLQPWFAVERASAAHEATAEDAPRMRLDTLTFHSDRAICTLTWRAVVPLEHANEAVRIVVMLEPEVAYRGGAPAPDARPSAARRDDVRGRPDLPFRAREDVEEQAPGNAAQVPPAAAARSSDGATIEFDMPLSARAAPPPPAAARPPPRAEEVEPVHGPAPRPTPPPPPWVTSVPPPAPAPSAPVAEPAPSPWMAPPRVGGATPPLTVGQVAAVATPAPPVVVPAAPSAPSTTSEPSPKPRGARLDKGEVLQLLWYEPTVVPRARRVPAHRDVLDELEQRARASDLDDVTTADPMAVEDRRDIFEILARSPAIADDRWAEDLGRAAIDHDKFVPGLVLVAGELALAFEETAMLRALVTVATPIALGDEALKAALQDARDFLALPDLISPASVVEGMSARIVDAFRKSKRSLAPAYLESHAERALIERRSYQRREVFGEAHLRATLQVSPGAPVVPAYLPAALASKLPMFSRFRVRALAELHLPEDHLDTHVAALRVLALGRVANLGAPSADAKGR